MLHGCRQGVISSSDGTTFELTSEVLTIERKVLKQSSELRDLKLSIGQFLSLKNRPFVMADFKHLSTRFCPECHRTFVWYWSNIVHSAWTQFLVQRAGRRTWRKSCRFGSWFSKAKWSLSAGPFVVTCGSSNKSSYSPLEFTRWVQPLSQRNLWVHNFIIHRARVVFSDVKLPPAIDNRASVPFLCLFWYHQCYFDCSV